MIGLKFREIKQHVTKHGPLSNLYNSKPSLSEIKAKASLMFWILPSHFPYQCPSIASVLFNCWMSLSGHKVQKITCVLCTKTLWLIIRPNILWLLFILTSSYLLLFFSILKPVSAFRGFLIPILNHHLFLNLMLPIDDIFLS